MNEHIVHMANGRLTQDTPPAHVHDLVERAAGAGAGGIVLHFHGGLVNEAHARQIAQNLTSEYEQAGQAFPIFFVWEAGLIEVLKNNLDSVRAEALFKKLLKLVNRIVARKKAQSGGDRAAGTLPNVDTTLDDQRIDSALALGGGPPIPDDPSRPRDLLTDNERTTLEAELQADPQLFVLTASLSASLRPPADVAADEGTRSAAPVVASTQTLMDPASARRLVGPTDPSSRGLITAAKIAKAVVMVAARVIKRLVTKRDHGLYATIVEEILREFYLANVGGKIWDLMKQDTLDSFGPDPLVHGGTAMLHELAAIAGAHRLPKVTLVGHSTGAVYICHWLNAAETALPSGVRFDVVFLAPACTTELFADTLKRCAGRIRSFRMFAMKDANELNDRLVPVLYPHSLLYFVSGVVEAQIDAPLVGMERYFDTGRYEPGEFPDIAAVARFFEDQPHATVYSVAAGGDGASSSAVKHGDFDNERVTIDSLKHLIGSGF